MDTNGIIEIDFEHPEQNNNQSKIYENVEEVKKYNCRPDIDKADIKVDKEPETEQESRSYLNNIMNFVKSENFDNLCTKWEMKSGYSKKKVAETFFQRVLGTVGDFGCIGCDTFESVVRKAIGFISVILQLAVTIITKLAKALFRVITLNYTRG